VQTQLALATPAVGLLHADLAALQVASYVLGGGMESRLMTVLREEKGYTYGINAQVAPERLDGRLYIGGAVQTDVTGPAVTDLFGILRIFAAEGISDTERGNAVEQLAGRAPLSYERPGAVAGALAMMVANGLPLDHVDRMQKALRETTVSSVADACRAHISWDRAVLVAVGDGAQIVGELEQSGLGSVTVVSA
jgi:predicted Zn-dependent peptidase